MKSKVLVTFMALCLVGISPIAAQSKKCKKTDKNCCQKECKKEGKEISENNEASDTSGHYEVAVSLEKPSPSSDDYLRKTNKVFDVVDQMPSFPQGNKALFEFIKNNIIYPEEAKKNKESGRVIVSFVVEKDGSLSDVRIVKSIAPSLDEEAKRIVKAMPNWNPGKQQNVVVRVCYKIPVNFKL